MNLERRYVVVTKMDTLKVPSKIKHVFSKIPVGDTVSTSSILTQYGREFDYPSDVRAKNVISISLRHALHQEMIKRVVDEKHIPEWFLQLDSISFWTNQLRDSRPGSNMPKRSNTRWMYTYHLWQFNTWLADNKSFTMNTFNFRRK